MTLGGVVVTASVTILPPLNVHSNNDIYNFVGATIPETFRFIVVITFTTVLSNNKQRNITKRGYSVTLAGVRGLFTAPFLCGFCEICY